MGWKEIESKFFTVCLPRELKPRKVSSDDSTVWRYVSREMELTIDLGPYSEKPPGDNEEPNYNEEASEVNGRKVTMRVFGPTSSLMRNRKYVSAAYFSDIGLKETKLALVARCSSPSEQAKAKLIFSSIRFKTPQHEYK